MYYLYDLYGRFCGTTKDRSIMSTDVPFPAEKAADGNEWRFVFALNSWVEVAVVTV